MTASSTSPPFYFMLRHGRSPKIRGQAVKSEKEASIRV